LTAAISNHLAPRIEAWLPSAWSANAITWLGSALMWLLLAGVLLAPAPWRESLAPLWVALLWTYCVLDHVDGCRARRRRASSAWGEFLDHGLDAWHVGITVLVVGAMGGDALRPAVVAATLACAGLATAATWLEQKLRGHFTLGALGPVEAVLAAGIYLALWATPAGASALRAAPLPGVALNWAELIVLLSALGNFLTALLATARTREVFPRLAALALVLATVALLGFSPAVGWAVACTALAILIADYSARVIASHLTGAGLPWPDAAGAALLACACVLPAARYLCVASLLWLTARAAAVWIGTAKKLSSPPTASAALPVVTPSHP
ncbi:MAG: CDP-alcohol phosphatidyltransferase, partial [Verrucomicrobiota bacterium]